MSRILVIVVTYNGMRWIERCLSSVSGSDVFVFDNASTDGTPDYIEEHFPQVHLVRSDKNLDFAGGNNAGFRYALEREYEAVYLLNQDAWLLPGGLDTMMSLLDAHPEYGILSPMQMDADLQNCNLGFKRDILPTAKESDLCNAILDVPYVFAAHWIISRKCLETIGLFASLFPHYGNDDNFCHRALYHGFRIGLAKDVQAVHDHKPGQKKQEQIIYQNYVMSAIVRLCDIRRPYWTEVLRLIPFALVKTVKYKSLRPLERFPEICRALPQTRRTRKLTRIAGVKEV